MDGRLRRLVPVLLVIGFGLPIAVTSGEIGHIASAAALPAFSGQAVVNAAAAESGEPYCYGGGSPSGPTHGSGGSGCTGNTVGFDCTGLTLYAVYQASGGAITLPHDSSQASAAVADGGQEITDQNSLQPGDLVFFGGTFGDFEHSGVYAGNGEFWDANDYNVPVQEHSLSWEEGGSGGLPFVGGVRLWTAEGPPPPPSTGTDLALNGGFNDGTQYWSAGAGTNYTTYGSGQGAGTDPYEGSGYLATNTSQSGGSMYQDVALSISTGQTFCASAEVVTDGNGTGAGGTLALWLLGDTTNDQSIATFGDLPGGNSWTPVSTCVTASGAHNDLRIQFYPDVNGPTLAIDAVDAHPDLALNGGFNDGTQYWSAGAGTNYTTYGSGQGAGTDPYEGSGYLATNTSQSGGSMYQDVALSISTGQTFCASAEVVTDGNGTGAGGTLALWLLGDTTNDQSIATFGDLPGGNSWTPVSTCVTASGAHNDLRIQFYPDVNGPTLAIDAVDAHPDLALNGGFNDGTQYWSAGAGTNYTTYGSGQGAGTDPYEGSGYLATNTSQSGGSMYQDVALSISTGQTFCASAEVVTDGNGTGAGGTLALWLLGDTTNDQSIATFGDLPGGNSWTPVSTCVTASGAHNDLRIQFYPDVNGPTLAIDAVDTQAKGFGVGYPKLSISSSTLPSGTVQEGYSDALSATGGAAAYTWSLLSGSLPAGLTLAPNGVVSGTPTASCTCTFNVRVVDSSVQQEAASASLTLSVVKFAVATKAIPNGEKNASYTTTLATQGGIGPYRWSLVSGSLPAGVTLSRSGTLSGDPKATGTYHFTLQVKDSSSPALIAKRSLSLTIKAAGR